MNRSTGGCDLNPLEQPDDVVLREVLYAPLDYLLGLVHLILGALRQQTAVLDCQSY